MNPAHYFASRYYEHWLSSIERNLIEKGIVSEQDLNARTQQFLQKPDARPKRTENPELSARILGFVRRGFSTRMPTRKRPRFRVGDRVLTRNLNPKGHTRLPRYARGKRGKVARVYDAFIYPNTNAHGLGRNPQILYSVRFDGRELWGADAEPHSCAYLDMWEDYLE